jgi:hypothetical protein
MVQAKVLPAVPVSTFHVLLPGPDSYRETMTVTATVIADAHMRATGAAIYMASH